MPHDFEGAEWATHHKAFSDIVTRALAGAGRALARLSAPDFVAWWNAGPANRTYIDL